MMFNIIVTIVGLTLAAAVAAPMDSKTALKQLNKEFNEMNKLITAAHQTLSEADSEITQTSILPRNPKESEDVWRTRNRLNDAEHMKFLNQFKEEKKADLLKRKDEIVSELNGMKDKAIAALSSTEPADLGQLIESSRREFRTRAKNGIIEMTNIRSKIFDKSNLVEYEKFSRVYNESRLNGLALHCDVFEEICANVERDELQKNYVFFADAVARTLQQIDKKFDECIKSDKSLRSKLNIFLSEANTIQYKKVTDVVLCTSPWPSEEGEMKELTAQLAIYYRQHETKVREIGNKLFPIFNDIADASHSHGLMVALQFTRSLTIVEVKYNPQWNRKPKWNDERNQVIHHLSQNKLKSEDEIERYFIRKLFEVLKWFNQRRGQSNKMFAANLFNLFLRQFKQNVKDISLADWMSHPPSEWPAWYRFVEFAIWQASNDYLLGDSEKAESEIQRIIFNSKFD